MLHVYQSRHDVSRTIRGSQHPDHERPWGYPVVTGAAASMVSPWLQHRFVDRRPCRGWADPVSVISGQTQPIAILLEGALPNASSNQGARNHDPADVRRNRRGYRVDHGGHEGA